MCRESCELQVPQTTISKNCKHLLMKPHKLQLARIKTETCQQCSCLGNRKYSCHPQAWNKFTHSVCVLCHFKGEGLWPLIFHGKLCHRQILPRNAYLMASTQLEEGSNDFIFQYDVVPSHFHMAVWNHLNMDLPWRWLGHAGANDVWCSWPPRSPDLTPGDFLLWGYIKYKVLVLPLLQSLPQLRQQITSAIASSLGTQYRVWAKLDYCLWHLPCDLRSRYRVSVRRKK
jgi:hypothetical protein